MKKSAYMPYGLSLMTLRGATADLEDAISSKNVARVRTCAERLHKAKADFDSARKGFDKNSFVEQTYSQVEDQSTIAADTMFQTAVLFVRGTLSLV